MTRRPFRLPPELEMNMKFSLITTTLGRTTELNRLLASIDAQTCRDFEMIIVDQNSGDMLEPILAPYRDSFPLLHVHSARGASHGRNIGMAHASGDFITFPDDDCWYPPRLLEDVATLFATHPEWDGLSGRPANSPRWSDRPGPIGRWNVWKRAIEWTMFLHRPLVEHVGDLNEHLGPGAGTPFGAGEGTEYLIRALAMNFTLSYQPSIQIFHPDPTMDFEEHVRKSRYYAMGQGRVLQLGNYPAWFATYQWMRPLAGAALGLVRRKPRQSMVALAVVEGIIGGWTAGPDKVRSQPASAKLPLPSPAAAATNRPVIASPWGKVFASRRAA
jgi:glycosyltransferase involved in cell wall biosynthesis